MVSRSVIRLFPDDNPNQTVRHVEFKLAPAGVMVLCLSYVDTDGEQEASAKIASIRGAHKIREVESILAALLKILRGHFNMGIQIDSEGGAFKLNSL